MKTCEIISSNGSDPSTENRVISVELPTGKFQNILTRCRVTVRHFKTICELQIGIPTELQRFSSEGHSELQDWLALHCVENQTLKLTVPIWWNKLICAALEGDVDTVYRRIQLPMQQITKEERASVTLFIACCRGHEATVSRILTLNHLIDQNTVTSSGRTLLHAAAANSKPGCFKLLTSNLCLAPPLDYLTRQDINKETPLDISRKLKKTETEMFIHKLQEYYERKEGGNSKYSIDLTADQEHNHENDIKIHEEHKTSPQTLQYRDNSSHKTKQTVYENKSSSEVPSDSEDELIPNSFRMNEGGRGPANQKKEEGSPLEGKFTEVVIKSQNCDVEEGNIYWMNGNNEESNEQTKRKDAEIIFQFDRVPSPTSPEETPLNKLRRPQLLNTQPLMERRIGRVCREENISIDVYRPATLVPYSHTAAYEENLLPTGKDRGKNNSNHLPTLENQNLVSQKLQDSLSCFEYENRLTVSAPSSPLFPRRVPTNGRAENIASAPVSPSNRRASEPFEATGFHSRYIARFSRPGRESTIGFSVPSHGKERRKSRSICEVTLAESLQEQLDNEARLERPWNAWILAKRKDSTAAQLTPPTDPNLNVPRSPTNSRRRSFEQWFTGKELEQLRLAHAKSQVDGANEALGQGKHFKGKSFEEWMDDKRKEIEKKREKEKEIDESQKLDEVKRERRRRESQVRYEKWLKKKEEESLIQEQQLLDQARDEHTKLRKKWEEEDLKKKENPPVTKVAVIRTRSCPNDEKSRNQRVQRNRIGSLQPTNLRKFEGL